MLVSYFWGKNLCGFELNTTSAATCRLTDNEALVNEVEGQLKKLAITASNRKDHMFLSINTNRQGYISKKNLHDLVSHHHLPADPDIIDGVRTLTCKAHSNGQFFGTNW